MEVQIDNRQDRHPISLTKIQDQAKAVLNALGSPDGELSILIVDDPHIAALNQKYLNRNGATNVIAFPMQEGRFAGVTPQLLGDVVISADTAMREAGDAGIDFQERLTALLIHGILHLFGYDHVANPEDAAKMEKKSRELIVMVGGK